MKHGITLTLPPDFLCPNCKTKDLDTKTIEQTYQNDTYVCVRAECRHCRYVYSSMPLKVVEPLVEEEEDND